MEKITIDTSGYKYFIFTIDGFSKADELRVQYIELFKIPTEEYLDHELTMKCCEILGKDDGHELGHGGFDLNLDQIEKLLILFNSDEKIQNLDYQFEICGE